MKLTIGNILVFVVLLFAMGTEPTLGMAQRRATSPSDEPLILTPFIQNGLISEARAKSRVPSVSGMNLESYSGYFTVREKGDVNLFFWFFPALNDSANKPIVLWLNGGPGLTSIYGTFDEIGPYYVTTDGKLDRRNVTWLLEFNVLFIDTPVGAGFSYAESVDFYTNTTRTLAEDLIVALNQFFEVFSEFQQNDFYLSGESYASKYAIVTADIITSDKLICVNFKGLILISGMFDPEHMTKPAEYLYQVGIIDKKARDLIISNYENVLANQCKAGLYKAASETMFLLTGGGGTPSGGDSFHPSYFELDSGIVSSDNILYDNVTQTFESYIPFVNSTPVRQALHVGTQQFNEFPSVIITGFTETGDFATPYVNQLQNVLNKGYKVITISGNMDYLVPSPTMAETVDSLVWEHAAEYAQTTRIVWKVNANDENSAGYVTCAANLCFGIVRNAGHHPTADEPLRTLTLIDRFINDKPFNA